MYKTRQILTALFTAFCVSALPLQAKIHNDQLIALLPQGANVGFVAKNLHQQQIIAAYNADTLLLPASTQKIVTALAAKLQLGDEFRFTTSLLTNGEIKNKQLHGDLIVRFTGDPDFTSGQLYQLLAQLHQQGIEKIHGDILLDTRIFTSHDKGLGWIWNDLTMCFNSPPAAVNIDNNCFSVQLDANQEAGSLIKVNVPAQYPVQVFSQAYVANKNESGYCQLDVVAHDNNRYYLKGCLARQSQPIGLSFAWQDPNAYAASLIQRQLKKLNIEVKGKVKQPYQQIEGKLLAQHTSKPLPDLVKKMIKKSDNQIADALFRAIGYSYYQHPTSFQLATQAVQHILKSKTNIELSNHLIADGSGLSRYNLLSANLLLQILEYIAAHDAQLNLLETFPIAAVDGTLSGRGSMLKPPLAQNIKAKTGALKGVYNLAGFMQNQRGETIAFVQFINGYNTGELEKKTKRAPLVQFETQFYQGLFEE